MITYDKIKFIYFNQRKYNSDIIIVDKFDYEKLDNIKNDGKIEIKDDKLIIYSEGKTKEVDLVTGL